MSQHATVEERVTALELIKRQLKHPERTGQWLDEIAGSMKDHPDFDEMVKLGREFRQSQTDSD